MPKISVITPSFNQGKYIEETILSVINQNYPNMEFIIIDGGSSDNTIEIIKKYEKHIYYWESQVDKGQSDAINKGFRKASGEIVTWINSDDVLTEGSLYRIAELFIKADDKVGVIHGGTVLFNEHHDLANEFGHANPTLERYLSGLSFSQPAAFIRKKYLDKVGNLNEKYHYGMDYDLFSKLILICEFKKVDILFSKYRIHQESKSIAYEDKFIDDWICIFFSVINNLNLSWIREELNKILVFDNYKNQWEEYNFEFIRKTVDEKQMLYYFLSSVFKADYRNGNFHRAKQIYRYLESNYKSEISRDSSINIILNRLRFLPPLIIFSIRKIRYMMNQFKLFNND